MSEFAHMSSLPAAAVNRRSFLRLLSVGAVAAAGTSVLASSADASALAASMVVYKDPNCGCCAEWVKHVRAAGYQVTVRDTPDMASVKASFGVPSALQSCHTARVETYTIEGHVPADVISKLLRDKPAGRGLAVPGMPMGSPGMEGSRRDAYNVMLFDKTGKSIVYASR